MFKIVLSSMLLSSLLVCADYSFIEKMSINAMTPNQKEQFEKTQKALEKSKEIVKVIVYFTSSSLDGLNQIAMTDEVSSLRKNGLDVVLIPITRGLDEEVFEYAKKLNKEVVNMAPLHRKEFKDSTVPLRINPSLFKKLDIQEVPAMAFGECRGKRASVQDCTFYYKATGETTLSQIENTHNIKRNKLFEEKQ